MLLHFLAYCISCSSSSKAGVEKNCPKMISNASHSFLIVTVPGFWLSPFRILPVVCLNLTKNGMHRIFSRSLRQAKPAYLLRDHVLKDNIGFPMIKAGLCLGISNGNRGKQRKRRAAAYGEMPGGTKRRANSVKEPF